ncbi:twin-arginine translocase TatA/TatE family subunit [Virgibacillus sp. Bac330]|uniref:twin-arginine translocase TatA/TatE family subunit n=1 Tax=Virgibacillus sp. Bac330 TaxID=2419841 RepID=UPI000EF4E258|nr:twin-arginine translocase TatA/TatE family subunit [Virgibacillus sp. Bac330]
MLQSAGIPELICILFIALIVVGSSKLPELGKVVGIMLKEFKKSTRELVSEDEAKEDKND